MIIAPAINQLCPRWREGNKRPQIKQLPTRRNKAEWRIREAREARIREDKNLQNQRRARAVFAFSPRRRRVGRVSIAALSRSPRTTQRSTSTKAPNSYEDAPRRGRARKSSCTPRRVSIVLEEPHLAAISTGKRVQPREYFLARDRAPLFRGASKNLPLASLPQIYNAGEEYQASRLRVNTLYVYLVRA